MPTFLLAAVLASLCACQQQADNTEASRVFAPPSAELARAIARDPLLAAADSAIRTGHPWRATQRLAPLLDDPARRTPAVVLLAARAAAGWNGWSEVARLLSRESWLDSAFAGEGHELLARSALERAQDSLAVVHARTAERLAPAGTARAIRAVLLARAHDRRNEREEARAAYERGAGGLRGARDWLLLRAAGVTADSAKRAGHYDDVRHPVAQARIRWTEAQALERAGNVSAAAAAYVALGERVTAIRLRLSIPSDSAGRLALRRELLDVIRASEGSGVARQAVELLDKYFATPPERLTPAEELLVARSIASGGPAARAVSGFAQAAAAGLLTNTDRHRYAGALARAGRTREAVAQYARVTGALAGDAMYERGRLLLSSDGAAARRILDQVRRRYPRDTAPAAAATYLLADLRTDDGRDAAARALFREVYTRYPTSRRADEARFRAALIAFVQGSHRAAAREFDALVRAFPRAGEAMAARYWSGRAWMAAGDPEAARARWRGAMDVQPQSFYASASARRLRQAPWVPPTGPDTMSRVASVDSTMQRIALLEALGMDTEARFEYDALEEKASASTAQLVATARALRDHGQTSRGIRLGIAAIGRGVRDPAVYRIVYPLVDGDQLVAQARAHGLDPALVAGLIRQESSFLPSAQSPAGARGLMQVMPSVGASIARQLHFPVWDDDLLYDADANLQLGMSHLATALRQYDSLAEALAAYNAGGSRVRRWTRKPGTSDPEVFIERIPFVETRDYVRIVQRNAEIYRALYGLR